MQRFNYGCGRIVSYFWGYTLDTEKLGKLLVVTEKHGMLWKNKECVYVVPTKTTNSCNYNIFSFTIFVSVSGFNAIATKVKLL